MVRSNSDQTVARWLANRGGHGQSSNNRAEPVLDSIAGVCPAAEWIEREIWELLGVDFRGHPDLRHLLLDDHWPQGDYPLRRGKEGAP